MHASATEQASVPETMQALVMRGKGLENLAVDDVPVPEPGPRQLLARVDAAGVCTSILKILSQGADHPYLNGWDAAKHPLILGDEGSLTLVKVGEELADRYRPGTRFGCQPAVDVAPINHRERYRHDAQGMVKCAVGYTLGGCLAQYLLVTEEVLEGRCLVPLPEEGMPHFAVSMAEPIGCVVSSHQRHVHLWQADPASPRQANLGLLSGGVAVVVGAGPMGQMHVELALRVRPRAIVVCDPVGDRLEKVRQQLSDRARELDVQLITTGPEKLAHHVNEASAGRGADDMILAVGLRGVQQEALELLGREGVANLFGGLPRGDHILELDGIAVHYNEIRIVGSSGGGPADLAGALAAIAEGQIDPGNYVAAVGGLENAPAVLQMILDAEMDGKAILYPHIRPTPLQRVDHWDGKREAAFVDEHTQEST